MILALSSDALPTASLEELIAACIRRGLSALHLVADHAHGLERASDAELAEAVSALRSSGIRLASFGVGHPRAVDADAVLRVCRACEAAFVVPADWPTGAAGRRFAEAKIAILQSVDVNAAAGNVADAAAAACLQRSAEVGHITLRGGGPEAAQHEGRGVGTLMARLALSGYQGILAIAPSSTAVLPVWRAWLHHGKNWGCGSKRADYSLVQLG